MARIYVRNRSDLCELNIQFPRSKSPSVTFNKFVMPQGSVINGKDVSDAVFFPIAAEVDKSDADYCIAPFPERFHIELNQFHTEEDGEIVRDRTVATPQEVVEAITESKNVLKEWGLNRGKEEEILEEVNKENNIEKTSEVSKKRAASKEMDEDLGEEI